MNHLEDRIEIVEENIKNLNEIFAQDSFDAIVCNPPYMKDDSGKMNESKQKLIARHEIEAKLEDFIQISFRLLKDKRPLYMVYRTERLADLITCFRKYKIEPKEIQFIQSKEKEVPQLFLIKGIKNGKSSLKVKKTIIVYQDNQQYTDEILNIYGKG